MYALLGQKATIDPADTDERWTFGLPGRSNDWVWAQHLLFHLAPKGKGVMVVSFGALFRGGREREIREQIVGGNQLDAVIGLPPGLLPGTSIPIALLVFDDGRANRKDSVLFIDAGQLGRPLRGGLHSLGAEDVERVCSTVTAVRQAR